MKILLALGLCLLSGVSQAWVFLNGEESFFLHDDPLHMAVAAAFLGAISTYLLFCLGLMIYRYRPTFLYAVIFLAGAFGTVMLRERLFFLVLPVEPSWWLKHILPLTIGLCHAGALLYVHADLRGTSWRRLRQMMGICAWGILLVAFVNVVFPVRDQLWLTMADIGFSVSGLVLGIILAIGRGMSGRLRDITYALCFGGFFVVALTRSLVVINSSGSISILSWYIAINLVGAYILLEYLLTLTGEHIKQETRKVADLTRLDLVNRFSHELRTPLNAVIGLADLLKNAREVNKVKNYADMIHTAGHTLLGLVTDILDFSKLGSARATLTEQPFRLDRVITEVLFGFFPKAMESKVLTQSLMYPGLPFFLIGDEVRLKQIFTNLVSNAYKYSEPEDIITVRIEEGSHYDDRVELLCSVSDSGCGIPADKLQTIFEPFAQAHIHDSTHLGGTGLGLAICKLLVEQMGGRIQVESKEGEGTTFYFNLWMKIDPNAPDLSRCFAPLQGKRILLVSHLPSLINQLTLQLSHWRANIILSKRFKEIVEQDYDLIVVDALAGISANGIAWLRRQPAHQAIHILEIGSTDWAVELPGQNVRVLHAPFSLLSILSSLTEHISGKPVDLLQQKEIVENLQNTEHRVLLVDDNTVNLMIASKLLESLQVPCDTAQSGMEGLDLLRSGKRYSLVLLDCEMPVIDGFEVARRWRQYERQQCLGYLPIVALTAHALNEVREECLAAGMDDVLYKPTGRTALVALLNRYSKIEPNAIRLT